MHKRSLAPAALLLALLCIPLASAHANRIPGTESPLAGSQLQDAPSEVAVTVSEPLDPDGSVLRVRRSDGVRVDVGGTTITDASSNSPRMSVRLAADAGPGAYTVTIQTLSTADGHPWTETFGFAVGDFAAPESSAPRNDVPYDAALGRLLAFAGLALAFGAALWLAWMPGSGAQWPQRLIHEGLLGAGLLHTAGLVVIIASTAAASHLDLAGFMLSSVGRVQGVRLFLGIGALLLAALSFHPATRTRSGPAWAILLLLAAGVASSRLGHASIQGLAGIASDFLHLAPAATWIGGLALLLWVLRNAAGTLNVQDVRRIGLRFGTAALACVLLLAVAGLATTLVIVGLDGVRDPVHLLSSPWGAFLGAKVGLTVAMVGLAAANRYIFLEPPTHRGLSGSLQRAGVRLWSGLRSLDAVADPKALRRVLAVEAGLGLVVLALAGALTSISPPTPEAPVGLQLTSVGDEHLATLRLDTRPALGSRSDVTVMVETLTGQDVVSDTCGRTGCLDLTLTYGGASEGGERLALRADGTGAWVLDGGILWTANGPATLDLRIQTEDVFEDHVRFQLNVA